MAHLSKTNARKIMKIRKLFCTHTHTHSLTHARSLSTCTRKTLNRALSGQVTIYDGGPQILTCKTTSLCFFLRSSSSAVIKSSSSSTSSCAARTLSNIVDAITHFLASSATAKATAGLQSGYGSRSPPDAHLLPVLEYSTSTL